jgi:hypothetical protein
MFQLEQKQLRRILEFGFGFCERGDFFGDLLSETVEKKMNSSFTKNLLTLTALEGLSRRGVHLGRCAPEHLKKRLQRDKGSTSAKYATIRAQFCCVLRLGWRPHPSPVTRNIFYGCHELSSSLPDPRSPTDLGGLVDDLPVRRIGHQREHIWKASCFWALVAHASIP